MYFVVRCGVKRREKIEEMNRIILDLNSNGFIL